MPKMELVSVSINAAGISGAFWSAQLDPAVRDDRLDALNKEFEGWLGIAMQISDAGAIMERFRVRQGATSTWGVDLPHLYDVWDSIADAMWRELGEEPLDQLVESAIMGAMNADQPSTR